MDRRPHGITSTTIRVTLQDGPESAGSTVTRTTAHSASSSSIGIEKKRPDKSVARSKRPPTTSSTINGATTTTATANAVITANDRPSIANRIGGAPPPPRLAATTKPNNGPGTRATTVTTNTATATVKPQARASLPRGTSLPVPAPTASICSLPSTTSSTVSNTTTTTTTSTTASTTTSTTASTTANSTTPNPRPLSVRFAHPTPTLSRKTVTSLPPPPRPSVQPHKRSTSIASSASSHVAAASGGLLAGASGDTQKTRSSTPRTTATRAAPQSASATPRTGVARQQRTASTTTQASSSQVSSLSSATQPPATQQQSRTGPTPRIPPRRLDNHVTAAATATTRPRKTSAASSPPTLAPANSAASTASTTSTSTDTAATMPPISDKPRPPILVKTSHLPRSSGPLTPKVASSRPPVHRGGASTPGRRGDAPLMRVGGGSGGAGVGSSGAPIGLDRGGGTPPPQAPREDYITPTISASLNLDNKRSSAAIDSKFFYASEARSPQAPTPPSRPASLMLTKSSAFLQGGRADSRAAQNESVTSNPSESSSKFVYANGVPDLPTSATTSPASSGSFGRPGLGQAPHPRPNSPTKHIAQMQGLRPPAPVSSSRSQVGTLGASLVAKRRVSSEAVPRQGIHSRSGSVESTAVATRITSPTPPRWPSVPSTPASPGIGQFQPAMTMASILQVAEELSEEEEEEDEESDGASDAPSRSEAQSPSKSGGDGNDLVANARRERKVQDLQITNASLEAINRTLERQLKKQTSELRRFKRLSRAGRLSTTAPSRPDVGLGLSVLNEEGDSAALGMGQSASPDADSKKPGSDNSISDEDDESDLSPSEDEADPSADKTEHVARRHQNRLELDISKHRQLLEDSQRMNQSLKRCLDWTEELIREGNKALAYNIRLGEVEATGLQLGEVEATGHRLAFAGIASDAERGDNGANDDDDEDNDDDNEDEDEDGQDGESHDFDGTDAMSEAQCTEEWIGEVRSELPKWGEKAAQQDRDSGVDLPPDGG